MTSPTPPSPPSLDPPPAGWPPPPPPPPGPAQRPALRRSGSDKVVGGVAGGLAEYTGIDPLLWRVGFIALTLAGGSGVLVYALLWLLVPSDGAAGPRGTGSPAAGSTTGSAARSPVPGITVAAVLVVVGVLVLLTRYTGFDLGPRGFLGSALFLVGAGLAVTALTGGRGRGKLVVLGVLLSVALLAVASAPFRNAGDAVGDRTFAPTSAADVPAVYRGGVGDLTLDLTRVPLSGLSAPVDTHLAHGVGDVEVLVPASADVEVRVSHGIGDVDVFGRRDGDGGFFPGTGSAPWTGDSRAEFVITVDGGIGDVEVSRA